MRGVDFDAARKVLTTPADPRIRRLRRADRLGQLPPFHAEGDLRAASDERRHAERANQPGDSHRAPACLRTRLDPMFAE